MAIVCALAVPGVAHADSRPLAFGDGGIKLENDVLFEDAVEGAAYDPAQDLVWFVSKGTLMVIDLRLDDIDPVKIATGLPEGAFAIEGVSTADYLSDDWALPYPVLRFTAKKGKKASIRTETPPEVGAYPKEDKKALKAIKKIKLVGKKWLAAQQKRARRTVAAADSTKPRVSLPESMNACETEALCGTARSLGTRYELVVVEDACTEVCATSCLLYDPVRGTFASLAQPVAEWGGAWPATANCADDYRICHEDTRYSVGSFLCTIGDTITCTESKGWTYFGWADVT